MLLRSRQRSTKSGPSIQCFIDIVGCLVGHHRRNCLPSFPYSTSGHAHALLLLDRLDEAKSIY